MHKPIDPSAPVSPNWPPATPESLGISGQQTRSHPHHPQTVGSYSTAPREESAQTGDEALHPAKARLLQLLTALQDVKTILDDTKPALSNVESELQAMKMRAHQLKLEVPLPAPEADEELGASGSIRLPVGGSLARRASPERQTCLKPGTCCREKHDPRLTSSSQKDYRSKLCCFPTLPPLETSEGI